MFTVFTVYQIFELMVRHEVRCCGTGVVSKLYLCLICRSSSIVSRKDHQPYVEQDFKYTTMGWVDNLLLLMLFHLATLIGFFVIIFTHFNNNTSSMLPEEMQTRLKGMIIAFLPINFIYLFSGCVVTANYYENGEGDQYWWSYYFIAARVKSANRESILEDFRKNELKKHGDLKAQPKVSEEEAHLRQHRFSLDKKKF